MGKIWCKYKLYCENIHHRLRSVYVALKTLQEKLAFICEKWQWLLACEQAHLWVARASGEDQGGKRPLSVLGRSKVIRLRRLSFALAVTSHTLVLQHVPARRLTTDGHVALLCHLLTIAGRQSMVFIVWKKGIRLSQKSTQSSLLWEEKKESKYNINRTK